MSQAIFDPLPLVKPDHFQDAIAYNQRLPLGQTSIRILQAVVGAEDTSGIFDEQTIRAFLQAELLQGPLHTWISEEITALRRTVPAIDAPFISRFFKSRDFVEAAAKVMARLGKLNETLLEAILKQLISIGGQYEAAIVAAEYYGIPIRGHLIGFRFEPKLTQLYTTQVAFTQHMVTPGADAKRIDHIYHIESAPHELLYLRLGPSAFQSLAALRAALTYGTSVKVDRVDAPAPAATLQGDTLTKAVDSLSFIYTSFSIRILQAFFGAPVTGVADAATVQALAAFQARQGMDPDGICGPGVIKTLLQEFHKQRMDELAIRLVVNQYGLWDHELAGMFYYESLDTGVEIDGSIPDAKFIRAGRGLHSLDVPEIARSMVTGISPLVMYQGSEFHGSYGARVDRAFLPVIKRINEIAGKAGVKIIISGPNAASFRPEGTVVQGAIVKPAARSNHKVGHAIDMNLWIPSKSKRYNSAALALSARANWDPEVAEFFRLIKAEGSIRWGGEFSTPDPVHLDDGINSKPKVYDSRFRAVQAAASLIPNARSADDPDESVCGEPEEAL